MVRVIRERSFSQKFKGALSNFKLFSVLGVMALVVGLTFYLTTKSQDLRQRASGSNNLPSAGVNLHVHFDTSFISDPHPLTFEVFKKQIDELKNAAGGQSLLIRFPIWDWEAFPFNNKENPTIDCKAATPVNCNPQRLDQYGQAIDYVLSKGFQVQLVTNVPQWAKLYSPASGTGEVKLSQPQYIALTDAYYRELGSRFSGKVRIWLVIGEADVQAFDKFADNSIKDSPLTTEYLSMLNAIYSQARTSLHSVDPNGLITTTSGGWPYNSALRDRWNNYFDLIGSNFDIISVDIYPDNNSSEIQQVSANISNLKSRYGKPVIMAETGICTTGTTWTANDQATFIPQTFAQARNGGADSVLLFEYQDNIAFTDPNNCQTTFGIKDKAGNKKSSYDTVMKSLLNPSGLLRVETSPASGVTITITSLTTNQVVSTTEWSVNWINLPIGNYKISYSNPTNFKLANGSLPTLPSDNYFTIFSDKTTTIIADMSNGTESIDPAPVGVPSTPTPIPAGLLRVETSPASGVTITITSLATNQVVSTTTWSVDWKSFPPGNYKISYTNPGGFKLSNGSLPVLPQDNYLTVFSNQTTSVLADMNKGTQTINPAPQNIPATPTPTLRPTNTPIPTSTPTPKPTTGLLRVETTPPTAANIKIFRSDGKVLMTRQWAINWEPLPAGDIIYFVQFSYPKTGSIQIPKTMLFRINAGRTTEILGNFTTGKTTVTYK